MKKITFIILLMPMIFAITPPKDGTLPIGVLDRFKEQDIGENYGDPGWVRKIASQRNTEDRDAQSEFYIPVLLGKYSGATTYFNSTNFDDLLFGNNSTGSLKDYYNEISYGHFQIDGSVSGWYQSSLNQSQAVDDVRQYVAEVASLADPDFDYGQFDNDGPDNIPNSGDDDGYVDGLVVVYPGCLSGEDNLWAHQSSLGSNQYVSNDQTPNGDYIIVNSYMVCPELPGSSNCITTDLCPMGLFAHEFGHILGLPDLYDRDQSNGDSEGLGEWCLMASGNWLGWYGDTPSHMSSWCKIEMGWMEPTISNNGTTDVPIAQLATSPTAIKVWEDDYRSNRYFLIENRQAHGFDSYINGTGLMIYHVNENRRAGFDSFGPINDDENDKLIDLEAADGGHDLDDNMNRGDTGDPFPGSTDNQNFNGSTNPSSDRNDGFQTGISVNNISEPDSVMYAEITPMPNSGYAIAYDEYGIASTALTIGTDEQWVGVLFTALNEGYVTEIDFGLVWEVFWNTDEMNWEVGIYDSFDGVSPGNLFQSVSGSSFVGGWNTVQIDSMEVGSGQDFFIGIRFSNNGYVYAYDNIGDLSGRSYFSSNGSSYDNGLSLYGDANIRAKLSTEVYVSVEEKMTLPEMVTLQQNYPNPFNPRTMLSFSIANDANVLLEIYDIKGRIIETLVDGNLQYGGHQYHWDASGHSSGVYFVRLITGNLQKGQKIMLIK